MPAFRKTPLNLAMGAALGGLVLVPSLSFAFAPDVSNSTIATDDRGDTVIGPFYSTVKEVGGGGPIFDSAGNITGTANLEVITSMSITNTSPTDAVLVKVRFREQKRSMEAMDLMVLLSPSDQFSWFLGQDGNRGSGEPTTSNPTLGNGGERPYMQWKDDSCVIGGPVRTVVTRSGPNGSTPPTLRTYFPTTDGNPFIDDVEDLSFGHVEVIGMAQFGPGHPMNLASQAKGLGSDQVCQGVKNNLGNRADATVALQGAVDVDNVLTGRFVVTASNQGIEYGDNFIALKNTFATAYVAPQSNAACTADPFVGAPAGGTYANPTNDLTLPCHSLYAWDNAESAHPHLGDMNLITWDNPGIPKVARLDGLTLANILAGDWSNNGINNVSTDQIITFFDKYVYTDYVNCVQERVAVTPSATIPTGIMAGDQVREWCRVNYEAQSLTSANGPVIGGDGNGRRDLFAKIAGYPGAGNAGGAPNPVFGSPAIGTPADTNEGTPFGGETAYGGSYGPLNAGFNPATSLCLTGNYVQMWDIDEREAVVNSPGGDGSFPLCDETFVMALLEAEDNFNIELFPSLVQYQDRRLVLEYEPFSTDWPTNRGIFELFINWRPTTTAASSAAPYFGAATSGLLAVQRRTDGPEINNGSLTALDRIVLPPNPLTPGVEAN
jgi:hypothetical protein